jgi:predicted NUDIX family NTP pyrophosphohydrolase
MKQISAGILVYRKKPELKLFLVHPGGPYFASKDLGSWTIPKGLLEPDEDYLVAAKREFEEETGFKPEGEAIDLGQTKLKSGKVVFAFGIETFIDPPEIKSNKFSMEWPPRSGKFQEFPEADRGELFTVEDAKQKITPAQVVFIERLLERLKI